MAYYTTETEVTADVSLEIEVTVQDQDGNEFECDIDGRDLELTAQIDTSKIKEEMEEEVREDLRQEVESQYISDIAESINPFNELAGLMGKVGAAYKIRQERSKELVLDANGRNFELRTQITKLRDEKEVLAQTVDALKAHISNQDGEVDRLKELSGSMADEIKALQTLKIHLDPPKEDK